MSLGRMVLFLATSSMQSPLVGFSPKPHFTIIFLAFIAYREPLNAS